MKLVARTPLGVLESPDEEYSEETYQSLVKFLERIAELSYFSFSTKEGEVYMTMEMIGRSLFVLVK